MNHSTFTELELQRDSIFQRLTTIGDFRPGNLYPSYRKCGKSQCHCAKPATPGHGPHWLLSRKRRAKTVSHHAPAEALEKTRTQIENCHAFRALTDELVEVSDALCQARIRAGRH